MLPEISHSKNVDPMYHIELCVDQKSVINLYFQYEGYITDLTTL